MELNNGSPIKIALEREEIRIENNKYLFDKSDLIFSNPAFSKKYI
jgi:hypothetical protein